MMKSFNAMDSFCFSCRLPTNWSRWSLSPLINLRLPELASISVSRQPRTTTVMWWTDLKYYSKLPFVNLGKRAKTIFSIRLITLIISIIFGSIIIGTNANHFPLVILQSDRSNVARGLYAALKDTFSGEKSYLTTSELKILATYIENHIEDTPQIIKSGLFGWCSVSYTSPELNYSEGSEFGNPISKESHHYNATTECYSYGSSYVFDYRGELSDIGLNIILAYAYTADFETGESTLSDTVYVPDDSYTKQLKYRKREVHRFLAVLTMSICVQAIMFIGTFFYYGSKGNESDDRNISKALKHVFAVFATLNVILTYIGFIIIILQVKSIQKQVDKELSSYGIYMKLGAKFITIIVFWFCFATIIFGLWAGPIWFNRSIKENSTETEQIPLAMDAYDYDYNYDNEYDDDDGDEGEEYEITDINDSTVHGYTFDDENQSIKSVNTTDSFENIDKAEVKVSSRTTSSSSTHDDMNPFSNNYEEPQETIHPAIPFNNAAFIRSEELFTKRKPPLLNRSTLDNEDLVPMSPIINLLTESPGKRGPITPNVIITSSDES